MMRRYGYVYLASALLLAGPAFAQTAGNFITQQSNNEWRASKLVGVDVYSSDNQKVGTIDDILLNSTGAAAAVVIGSGGVLGAGKKDVAVPYNSVNWSTQGRTVAEGTNGSAGTMGNSTQAATTAAQGYPDRAIMQMTKSNFDSAPTFNYAGSASSK
jgi:sporulation protein YlmC with PRC-barrel domain